MTSQYTGERRCPACDKPLVQKPGEKGHKFSQRKFCNHPCAVVYRQREWRIKSAVPLRHCEICGGTIERKSYSASDYAKTRTCSRQCGAKLALRHRWAKSRGITPIPAVKFESPEEWLKTHQVTKCPTAYAWGIQYMNQTVRSRRGWMGDGEVK